MEHHATVPNVRSAMRHGSKRQVELEYARIVEDSFLRNSLGEGVLAALTERYEELGGDLEKLLAYDIRPNATVLAFPKPSSEQALERAPEETIQQYNHRLCTVLWNARDAEGVIAQGAWERVTPYVLEANRGFIHRIAKEFVSPTNNSFEDYLSAGNVGMLEALKRFDPTRGIKLITYATWWVRDEGFKTVNNAQPGYYRSKYLRRKNKAALNASRDQQTATGQMHVARTHGEYHPSYGERKPFYHEETGEEIYPDPTPLESHILTADLRRNTIGAVVDRVSQFRKTLNARHRLLFDRRFIVDEEHIAMLFDTLADCEAAGLSHTRITFEDLRYEIPPIKDERQILSRERIRQMEEQIACHADVAGFPIARDHGEGYHIDVPSIAARIRHWGAFGPNRNTIVTLATSLLDSWASEQKTEEIPATLECRKPL